MVVLRAGFGYDFDARADSVAIRFDSTQRDVKPMACIGAAVHPQLGGLIEAGGDNIDAAVAIEVAQCTAAMTCRGVIGESRFACRGCHFPLAPRLRKTTLGSAKWYRAARLK